MTAQELVRFDAGDALVAYLSQPDASPTVCDPLAAGPHVLHWNEGVLSSVVDGVTSGRIDPGLWRRCVDALAGASPDGAALLVDAVGRGYLSLIEQRGLETSPVLQERLATVQAFYVERPSGLDGHPAVMGPILDELRTKRAARKLGPVAARFGDELLAVVDLERGRYGGRTVDGAVLDDLASQRQETLLRRFADRLPSKALRDEARRRVVRLAIAASAYPEVRADSAQVEERILRDGVNRISLREQPPSKGSLDLRKVPMRAVRVRQDLSHQTATLLGTSNRAGVSVLPELSFVDALWIEVAGVSRPVTICRPPGRLDPSPCISGDEVKLESPLAYLDRGGAFHFVDQVSAADAAGLARAGHDLTLPISVGGRPLLTFQWPLWFERPESLVLCGASGAGPTLEVSVDNTDPLRFAFTVTGETFQYRAVVEKGDLPAFRIVSCGAAGGAGSDGARGMDGASGLDGFAASCPSTAGSDGSRGCDGSRGGDGADGGDGGDGGEIDVALACGAAGCAPAVLESLRGSIVSEGGPGGPGGAGGPGGGGGRGGSGGAGTPCTASDGTLTSLGGGNAGMSGNDGASGSGGSAGAPGRPGKVRFN